MLKDLFWKGITKILLSSNVTSGVKWHQVTTGGSVLNSASDRMIGRNISAQRDFEIGKRYEIIQGIKNRKIGISSGYWRFVLFVLMTKTCDRVVFVKEDYPQSWRKCKAISIYQVGGEPARVSGCFFVKHIRFLPCHVSTPRISDFDASEYLMVPKPRPMFLYRPHFLEVNFYEENLPLEVGSWRWVPQTQTKHGQRISCDIHLIHVPVSLRSYNEPWSQIC